MFLRDTLRDLTFPPSMLIYVEKGRFWDPFKIQCVPNWHPKSTKRRRKDPKSSLWRSSLFWMIFARVSETPNVVFWMIFDWFGTTPDAIFYVFLMEFGIDLHVSREAFREAFREYSSESSRDTDLNLVDWSFSKFQSVVSPCLRADQCCGSHILT
jgi:hypothetical protein